MAKILLVDDNAALLMLETEVLVRAGHAVSMAADGKEAMRLVRTNAFDVVVTDLFMPEKEGLETIMELRQVTPTPKIIAMSGEGPGNAEIYLAMARQFGASQTLSKPFSGAELLAAVTAVLESERDLEPPPLS